jgi:hypothetical protein
VPVVPPPVNVEVDAPEVPPRSDEPPPVNPVPPEVDPVNPVPPVDPVKPVPPAEEPVKPPPPGLPLAPPGLPLAPPAIWATAGLELSSNTTPVRKLCRVARSRKS